MATILRAINDNGDKYDLDLLENIPFKLDISAIESGNIGTIFGVSSQKLTLPPSQTNNEFFGNLYDVNATPSTSFIKTVPCQVLQDGIEIFTGKLYLDSVTTDNQGNDLYNVVVVNETVDFKFLVKDMTFGDLDFSHLDHDYTYGNITGSWDKTLVDGAIFYPLVNYGFDEENPLDTQIKSNIGNRSFTNYDSPVRVDDFKPAIRLRDCLDAIFDKVNYTYTSSLFYSGSYTDDLYMLSTKDDKKGISDVNPISQSFLAYEAFNQDYPAPTIAQIVEFTTESYDNAGNYNGVDTFTAGIDGSYQFEINLVYEILGYAAISDERFVDVRVYKNASPIDLYNIDLTGTVQGQINVVTQNYNLSATDQITIRVSFTKSGVGAETFRVVGSTNTRFKLLQGPTSILGGNVNIANVYDNIEISSFLQGLIEKFNLVIEPLDNQRNVLKIETFNDWVDQGEIVDWTNKVDYSQKWEIKHPLQNQPKNIKFTDIEDGDAVNAYHKKSTGKTYGEFDYISESDLAKGEQTIGSFFAPTPMKGIIGAPSTVLPALAEKSPSEPFTRYAFQPRLLFHNGRQDVLGTIGKNSGGAITQNRYYFEDENGIVHAESNYGLGHHLSAIPAIFDETQDIHFGNTYSPGHWCYHDPQFNGNTKVTAWEKYWAFYINELYDVDARLVTLNIFLKPTELPQLQLNDKIFIDGAYYRINKISGANVTREASVQVELIKTLPRKLKFPRRRVTDLDGVAVDIVVDDATFAASGFVEYVDFESNLPYSGSAVPAAAERDGFQTFGTTNDNLVVWNTQKPVQLKFEEQTNLGLNRVDQSAQTIDARGDNNTVANNVSTARIEGQDNDVKAYSQFISVTGTNNTVGTNLERIQITGNQNTVSGSSNDSVILASNNSTIYDSSKAVIIGGQGTDNRVEGADEALLLNPFNITLSGSTNPVTVIGGDNVDITGGNYHVVIGKDNEISSTLDLNDYRFKTNILNGTYLDNDLYYNLEGHAITGYSGSTEFAYSGNGLYKYIYELQFDNAASGSGIATIELPGITSQDQEGRVILFKCDNSVSAANGEFYITSVGGTDTFDGNPGIYLKRPYSWLELRASQYPSGESLITEWRVIRKGLGNGTTYPPNNQGTFGSFYSTSSQAIAASGSDQIVQFDNTFTSQSIAISGSGTIQVDYAGSYKLTYTAAVENRDNDIHNAYFWIKYNGVDYPNSTVIATIPARKSATVYTAQPVIVQLIDVALNDFDKIELWWRGDSTLLSLNYETFGGTIPNSPSVFAQINAV